MKKGNKFILSGLICSLAALSCVFGGIKIKESNVIYAETGTTDTITLGSFDSASGTFKDANATSYNTYQGVTISFASKIEGNERMTLPNVEGYEVKDAFTTDYSKVISISSPKTASEIVDEYIKGITFENCSNQVVSIILNKDAQNYKTAYFADNDHYYMYVSDTEHNWIDAYNLASSMTYMGRNGYLATITSKEEDTFIYKVTNGSIGWLGGTKLKKPETMSDDEKYYVFGNAPYENEGYWYWASGPEMGDVFFDTEAVPGDETSEDVYERNAGLGYYFNWADDHSGTYEPSGDGVGPEQCLATLTTRPGYSTGDLTDEYCWNDLSYSSVGEDSYQSKGYLVEFGDQSIGDNNQEQTTDFVSTLASFHIHDDKYFELWTSSTELPTEAGNWLLLNDVALSSTWNVPEGETNLCLNGHVINANGGAFSVINVGTDATLNLYDCGDTEHNGYVDENGLWNLDTTNAHNGLTDEKDITGGIITGVYSPFGGSVTVSGTFNMYGGNIAGNAATSFKGMNGNGGGVNVANGGSFTMFNGNIFCNTSAGNAGGIYVAGTFEMEGGTISGCSSNDGGGVLVANGGTFNMSGGTISDNKAQNCGGGVNVQGTFNMEDGVIEHNSANPNSSIYWGGGGIAIYQNGKGTLSGGKIQYNTSTVRGGGILILQAGGGNNPQNVLLVGVSINNNTAVTDGGGIYFDNSSVTVKFGGNTNVKDNVLNGTITKTDDRYALSGGTQNNFHSGRGTKSEIATETYSPNGMSVGIYSTGAKITSATKGDEQYFFSDNDNYKVCFNNNSTEDNEADDYLELKTAYAITNNATEDDKETNNGYIVVDKNAIEGEEVLVIVVPNEGYKLSSLKYSDGTEHDITSTKSFTMSTTAVSITATFVEKQTISIAETQTNRTYNGYEQAFQIQGGEGASAMLTFTMTYYESGDWTTPVDPINAGSYNVKITRDEDDNYKAFELNIENGLVIEKGELENETQDVSIEYDGDDHANLTEIETCVIITGTEEEPTAKKYSVDGVNYALGNVIPWENIEAINIGTYQVYFQYEYTNYETVSGSFVLTINKAKVDKPDADTTQYVYNGEAQTYQLATSELYEIKGDSLTQTNAGIYEIVIELKDKDNYEWNLDTPTNDDQSIYWTIAKQKVEIPTIASKSYTGSRLTADIEKSDLYEITENNGGINAGEYDVILKLNDSDNYKWETTEDEEISLTFEITKAENSWTTTPSIASKTYDGKRSNLWYGAKFENVAYDKVEYYKDDIKVANNPTNTGTYKVIIEIIETANYSGLYTELTYTISPKEITVSGITAQDKTYDGNTTAELVYTGVTFAGKVGNDVIGITATGTFADKNVGISKNVAISNIQIDNTNYVLAGTGNQASTTATISALEVELSWTAPANLVYDENEKVPTVIVTNLIGDDTCSVTAILTENNNNINAGTFTFTASELSNSNYKLPSDAISPEYTITKATIEGESYEASITYDGKNYANLEEIEKCIVDIEENPISKKYRFDEEDEYSEDIPEGIIAQDAGVYYVYYCYEYSNYNIEGSLKLTINKAKVDKPDADTTQYVYNGEAQTYQLATSELYTIRDNLIQTNAGRYEIIVELKDKTNYSWQDNKTSDLKYYFTISQKEFEIVWVEKDFTYTGEDQSDEIIATYTTPDNVTHTIDATYYQIRNNKNIMDIENEEYTGTASNEFIGAGKYTLNLTTKGWGIVKSQFGSNYKIPSSDKRTHVYTISKATLTNNTQNVSIEYDGEDHANLEEIKSYVKITGTEEEPTAKKYSVNGVNYALENEIPWGDIEVINVGTIQVYFQYEYDNYETVSGSFTLTITKATIEGESYEASITYDGENYANLVEIEKYIVDIEENPISKKYRFDEEAEYSEDIPEGITAQDAGVYYVYYCYEYSNYNIEGSLKLTITKKPNEITNLTLNSWIYGETPNTPTADADFGEIVFSYEYYDIEENEFKYTTEVPTQAGFHTVKAEVAETKNHAGAVKTLEFEISKAQLTVTIADKTSAYGDDIVELSATCVGLQYEDKASDLFTLVTDATKTSNIGEYLIWAEENNGILNYEIEYIGTYIQDGINLGYSKYTITKATNEITNLTLNSWIYGETPKTPTATAKFGEIEYVYSKSDPISFLMDVLPTEIGNYIVKAYVIGNDNYDSATKELEFSILKRSSDIIKDENGEDITNSEVCIVDSENGINPDAVLIVEVIEIDNTDIFNTTKQTLKNEDKIANNEKIYGIYDTKLLLGTTEIQPNGNITVKMLIPSELGNKEFKVYNICNGEISPISNTTVDENGYIIFDTDKLSQFVFIANNDTVNAGAIVGIVLGGFFLLLLLIYLLGYFLLYRRGKLDDSTIRIIYKILPRGNKNLEEDNKDDESKKEVNEKDLEETSNKKSSDKKKASKTTSTKKTSVKKGSETSSKKKKSK